MGPQVGRNAEVEAEDSRGSRKGTKVGEAKHREGDMDDLGPLPWEEAPRSPRPFAEPVAVDLKGDAVPSSEGLTSWRI